MSDDVKKEGVDNIEENTTDNTAIAPTPSTAADTVAAITEFLKTWPVMDTLDFEGVTADVTHWSDGTYTATLNFCLPNEADEPPYSGYSLCTQIAGEDLEEVHYKLTLLMASGLFDGLAIGAIGTIWNEDGDEVGEVDWNDYGDDDEDDDEDGEYTVEEDETGPTRTKRILH